MVTPLPTKKSFSKPCSLAPASMAAATMKRLSSTYSKMTIKQLKPLLKERGLIVSGKKSDLIMW